jgi:hypothetical protein
MTGAETQNDQVEVVAVIPGRETQTLSVERGTTLSELAAELGLENAERISALDDRGEPIGPRHEIVEDSAVSFVYKLAGA